MTYARILATAAPVRFSRFCEAADIVSPEYRNGTTTVVKILPALDLEALGRGERRFVPFRYGPGDNEYNQFYFPTMVATLNSHNRPDNAFTRFLVCAPGDVNYDVRTNPVQIFFDTLSKLNRSKDAERLPQSWSALLSHVVGKGTPVSAPKVQYYLNALIMQRDRQVYPVPLGLDPNKKPVLLQLSSSAMEALLAQIDKFAEQSEATTGTFLDRYAYGDFTDMRNGYFVSIFPENHDPRLLAQTATAMVQGYSLPAAAPSGGKKDGKGKTIEGYACYLHRTFPDSLPGAPAGSPCDFSEPSLQQFLLSRCVVFHDAFTPLSHAEQVREICRIYPNFKAAVVYALGERFGGDMPEDYRIAGQQELNAILNPTAGYAPPQAIYPHPGQVPSPYGIPSGYAGPGASPQVLGVHMGQPPATIPVAPHYGPPAVPVPLPSNNPQPVNSPVSVPSSSSGPVWAPSGAAVPQPAAAPLWAPPQPASGGAPAATVPGPTPAAGPIVQQPSNTNALLQQMQALLAQQSAGTNQPAPPQG